MPITSFRLFTIAMLASPGIAAAQHSPAPDLVPGLDRFDLAPRTEPTPVPRATPTPRPTATATATRAPIVTPTSTPTSAAPAPRATTPARPTPTPTPTSEPTDAPATVTPPAPGNVAPTPVAATPTAPAAATPTAPAVTVAPVPASGRPLWPILLGLAALAALVGALFYRRRRAAPDDRFTVDVDKIATPEAPPPARPLPDMPVAEDFPPASPRQPAAPPSPAPVFLADTAPAQPRASLELTVRVLRAGTNLTSAAVDYEIDIRNSGERDAVGIRLDLRLLSASADQDQLLAALYAAPIDKPIVAPFEIPAGDQVSLGGMAMLPRDLLTIMSAQGRDFFVPLLSVNLVYGWGGDDTGQTASAHVVGVERAGGGKMAPFRLDTGPRMHDGVGAREHTLTVRR